MSALVMAAACGPLRTDRPTFTQGPATMPPAFFQAEAGVHRSLTDDADTTAFGELLLRAGVNEYAELRVQVNSFRQIEKLGIRREGFEALAVGTKVALLDVEEAKGLRPGLGVVAMLTLPGGSGPHRSRAVEPEAGLSAQWTVGSRWELSTSGNYANRERAQRRVGELSGGLAAEYRVTDRLGTFAELFGERRLESSAVSTNYLNGGVTLLLSDDFQLDVRIARGVGSTRHVSIFGAGAAVRW